MGFRKLFFVVPEATVNSDESVIMETKQDFTELLGNQPLLGKVGTLKFLSPILTPVAGAL